jgi:Zn-dependent protease with chaperone function
MDFFARQDQARRNTARLVFYFALAVIGIILAVYLVLAALFLRPPRGGADGLSWLWNIELLLYAVGGTSAVIAIGTLSKIVELARGGSVVATALGGREIDPHTTDLDERKLLNVVEEMTIAAGIPMPELYLLEREDGINAFAAGNSTSDAAVGVTRGCLRLLSRDELQGVIAHEFSHILNGDMRLNLRLIGILNGILCLAIIGHFLLRMSFYGAGRSRSSGRKEGANPLPLIGLALLILGSIGVFFGRLIKSAVSRQREFLADAAAVQFTRNPDGLVGALKKIGGLAHGSRIQSPRAEEASHLFFGNALNRSWLNLLSTHPPLVQRIQVWEPSFQGEFPQVVRPAPEPEPARRKAAPTSATHGRIPPPLWPATAGSPVQVPVPGTVIAATNALDHVGQPTPDHLLFAAALIDDLPNNLRDAAHEPMSATALIYCLLLSPDEAARGEQLEQLGSLVPEPILREVRRLLTAVTGLDRGARLPLIELSLPALRRLAPSQYKDFEQAVQRIIESDRQIDLFEYALRHLLRRHLEPHFKQPRKPIVQYYVLKPVIPQTVVVLSGLAHVGHDTITAATEAFRTGLSKLDLPFGQVALLEPSAANLSQLDAALDQLAQCTPQLKKQILGACAATVAADDKVQPREAELLRAVADALDCPLPPFLAEPVPKAAP